MAGGFLCGLFTCNKYASALEHLSVGALNRTRWFPKANGFWHLRRCTEEDEGLALAATKFLLHLFQFVNCCSL